MIQRKTQNLAYWRDEFSIDESDHEYLYDTLGSAAEPMSLHDLALGIIERRCQLEDSRIRNELARGLIYDPKDQYKVGDAIVFPAFDFRLANVIASRAGENPEHGDFDVITVQFEDNGSEHLFAADLDSPHRLNREGDEIVIGDDDLLTPEEIYNEVGDSLSARLEKHLKGNPDYFISAGPMWLTTDQMVQINVGHLNIAEAVIEMQGKPVPITELLEQVEVDRDASESVRVFSLETALHNDERFVEVGQLGESAWFLRRMIPEAALQIPPQLRYVPVEYDRSALDVELLQTEWELNDEWTVGGLAEEVPPQVPSVTLQLIYPHLSAGTLPLTAAARSIFPQGTGVCTAVTLIDGRWGSRFQGWVHHEGRYVAGLDKWYKEHKLPVGAQITLERTNDPSEIVVDFKPQRMKRQWVRAVRVEEGRLQFQMQRKQISCDYNDHLSLFVDDPAAVAELSALVLAENLSIEELVETIMPELTKLSPQGTTHVSTVYSAVNVLRRMPPGPIFAALSQLSGATDTGSGYWSL